MLILLKRRRSITPGEEGEQVDFILNVCAWKTVFENDIGESIARSSLLARNKAIYIILDINKVNWFNKSGLCFSVFNLQSGKKSNILNILSINWHKNM